MRRSAPPVPRRASYVRLFAGITIAVGLALTTISAQIPGRNVNMVAGNTWPDGDPYLQRQNEPSIGASTRNPLHLLAGSNDYRTVDLPGLTDDEVGDAWLGLFKSYDGGQRWTSTLLPGYPQDQSTAGQASPIYGYGAGADAVVRAGTNGMMYYAGLVFDRANPLTPDVPGKSAIFVSRFIDNNNKEAGDTFEYLNTRALQTDPGGVGGNFLDKPWMVVDIPRDASRCTIVTAGEKGPITQNIPAGPVYVAYTLRSTDSKGPRYDVMFTRSADCGNTWTTPVKLNSNSERANQGATLAVDPRNGNVHIAWRQFDVSNNGTGTNALMATKFTFGGKKIDPPGFARKFAKPKNGNGNGLNLEHFYKKGGVNKALEAAELSPLDQSTSASQIRFRTNAYPTMVVDETGRVYLAFAERGYDPINPDPVLGAARVLVTTSMDGQTWTAAQAVNAGEPGQKGHQLMPSLTYAGGKLMLVYYDIRETRAQAFTKYIDDKTAFQQGVGTGLRHTIDLRASMASPGAAPAFAPSVAVSEYLEGPRVRGGPSRPWQVNPPNLPMFQKGTAPFIGDYIDVTAAPNFVVNAAGKWVYNSAGGSTPPIFHAVWTDNRDVRVPLHDMNGDGNPWNDYVPPGASGSGFSIFDPTKRVPACIPGNAGSRNQNVYTARITGGLLVGSPGNTKRLGYRIGSQTTELMQRSFVVFAQNTGDVLKRFRFTITNQPIGGRASFDQFSAAALTAIDAEIPYRSTASRTVYASSTDPHAIVNVAVQELELVNGVWMVKAGGLASVIVLNPDIDNPDIDNPDIDNPDIDNPDIDNVEVYNPDIDNPDIDNPDIDNPDIDNPDIDNPDIDNVEVANPDIDNPDIDNPDIDNPDIDNPDIDNPDIDNPDIDNASLMTDISWSMTNTGNTTASYNVNLFFAQQTYDPTIKTQLILYRTYKTPVVVNCELKSQTRNALVANVPNPQLVTGSTGEVSNPNDPEATNATIYLAPGESAKITLRVFDPSPDPGSVIKVTNADGSTALVPAQFVPNEDVTPVIQQQSVNTVDVDNDVTEPPIVVQFPAPQTVADAASTSENTPVTLNVLANDSTAFGSTKVISFHPAGMAAHSGGTVGDIAYQPSTGFLYTGRGAVDPATNALVARFPPPPGGFSIVSQIADPVHGINYGRTNGPAGTLSLVALDARPDSPTFHRYLPMPILPDSVLAVALDAPNGRLYAAHGPPVASNSTPTTVSVINVMPGDGYGVVVGSIALPTGVRAQTIAVNTRTQKVYVAANGVQGGVFVIDVNAEMPSALRIPNTTQGAFGVVVNEAANLVFASSSFGPFPNSSFSLYAIDGATNAATSIPTALPFRFGSNDERLAVHESSGKVYMRLQNTVVVIDGKRGSPTRNTVIATINVGQENGGADIAVDQAKGIVVTVGSLGFQADVIDVATNALLTTIPLSTWAQDVAIDPIRHRAFLGVFTHVVPVQLDPAVAVGLPVAVFIESGGIVINPLKNKAYAGLFTTKPEIAVLSGAGREGSLSGTGDAGRYFYSAWHNASNRGFFVNQGNAAGTSATPGTVVVVDGETDAVLRYSDVPANPFGIGIDQVTNKVYVASLSAPNAHGQMAILDALAPENPRVLASFTAAVNPTTPTVFPLNAPGALLSFGRHVVVNPVTHKVYVMLLGGSATSLAVLDPATNALKPLDGVAGTPLHAAQAAAEQNWGRVNVIRVHEGLNRVFVGYLDSNNVGRIVALDGNTDAVVGGPSVAGSHSNRHMASFLVVNEPASLLYVTDYTNGKVTMLGAGDLEFVKDLTLPGGPSATAFNPVSNRLYVSSIDSKTLSAIDGTTLQVISRVRMPLAAYFMWVDPVESRVYTSGGDSADESGVMVVTDVLGQLGTNVSVTSVGSALKGTTQLNADNSVTYTPAPGQFGPDSFTYNIAAPTGTAIGTVHVNVVPSTPAATAFPDAYSVTQAQLLTVPAPGPLANDAARNSPSMSVQQTTANGTLTPQPDGSFTYQPDPGFVGVDTFTYHAIDGSLGKSNEVTVSITVNPAANLIVTNTNDSGAGSLRQALITANMDPGATIEFNIATGTAPFVIAPQSALPTITAPITINGYSQPGASANTLADGTNAQIKIQLSGANAGNFVNGLTINSGGTTVRGLAIGGFNGAGIMLDVVGGNVIEGNFIGTNATGTTALGNGSGGIAVHSASNTIGGSTLGARNLISGNAGQSGVRVLARHSNGVISSQGSGTVIKGNLIGTNASGLGALPNRNGVTLSVPNVTIGGALPAERNVVGGNTDTGISAFANTFDPDQTQNGNGPLPAIVVSAPSSLTIRGNYIGLKADGSGQLGNFNSGVFVAGANSTIANNVISGNFGPGLSIGANTDNAASSPTFGTVWSEAINTSVTGNIIGLDPTGTTAIANISSGLNVNVKDVTVGGTSAAARNVIAGNGNHGISIGNHFAINAAGTPVRLTAGDDAIIQGNYLGLNAAGTVKIGNTGAAIVSQASRTRIGGPNAGEGNVIVPGNNSGIRLDRHTSGAAVINAGGESIVQGNIVGLDAAGTARMNGGNNFSVAVNVLTASNQIVGNIIAGNGATASVAAVSGLSLFSPFATGNVVRGNIIGTNANGDPGLGNTWRGVSIQDATNNTIGGNLATDRNIIVANGNFGISFDGTSGSVSGNIVQGNYIGVKADGITAMGNSGVGVNMYANAGSTISGNTIGGNTAAARNVIAGNTGDGVRLGGGTNGNVNNNTIAGNYIGVASDGTTARGNGGNGIYINNAVNNTIGGPNAADGNVIANSFHVGVGINAPGVGNRILSNRIYGSNGLGIDLSNNGITNNDNGDADGGANDQQNFPVLTRIDNSAATTSVDVDMSSFVPGPGYTVQFFANSACNASGHGEGRRLVGSATLFQPGAGNVALNERVPDTEFLSATATDSAGNTSEFSQCRPVVDPTIVTSANDSGSGSLRAAMTYANATPGRETIRFSIPGVTAQAPAVITLVSPLPIIASSVAIDATTQPGYDGKPVVEVNGQNAVANGFETQADISNTSITGLAITRFTNAGVFLMQTDSSPGGGSQVTNNFIGTDRFGTGGKGNNTGVVVRSDSSFIGSNVISGNTQVGVRLENDADSVVVTSNKIGVMHDGITAQPNGADGIRMYDSLSNNVITGNIISKNNGWGINVQDSVAGDVFGTMIYGNTIGLDAVGNVAGNRGGGIRLENAPATDVGRPGAARNVISGNGGPNPQDIGVGIQVIGPGGVNIRNNYIGLDPTGMFARSNNNKGIVMDGPATIGGPNANDRNYISGNGDTAGGAGIIVGPTVPNGSVIAGNVIGLNVNGQQVGNGYAGITVRSSSALTIGGSAAGANVISGNGFYGISIIKVTANDAPANVLMTYNRIGTDSMGTLFRPNGAAGVYVADGTGHRIGGNSGAGNIIAGNGNTGIRVVGAATQVRIQENAIHDNAGLGIDLNSDGLTANDGAADSDSGPNSLQNYAVLQGASQNGSNTQVQYDPNTLNPGMPHTVEFFSSPTCDAGGYGEGATFRGSIAVNGGAGLQTFTLSSQAPTGHFITATTTDSLGNTSEFSNCVTVAAGSQTQVGGIVRYSSTPLVGTTVKLVQGSPTNSPLATTTTNEFGYYQLNNVAPGTYFLRVDGPDSSYLSWTAATITVASSNVSQNMWAPKKMTLVSPAFNATDVTAKPELTWMANPEAVRYVVQLNRTSDFALIEQNQAFTNSYTVQTLLTGSQNYKWQVDAYDSNNVRVGGTDQTFNFTVIAPIVVNVAGTSGGLNNPNCCAPGSNNTGTAATLATLLANGQKVWISATGGVNWFPDPATAPPAGAGIPTDGNFLAPSLPAISLVANFNGGAWQFVGNGPTMMQAVGSGGQLLLAVNDSRYDDNGGFWTVTIQR